MAIKIICIELWYAKITPYNSYHVNEVVYFKKSYITFLKKLSINNNNDWFEANLVVFESEVNIPFEKFILDLIKSIHSLDPEVRIQPVDAIYKIRKPHKSSFYSGSPYNLHMAALISKYGKKTPSYPGTYIKIDPKAITVKFGIFDCDSTSLEKIRNAIILDYDSFESIIKHRDFKNYFGKIKGTHSSNLANNYKELLHIYPILSNSQFYCEVHIHISLITAGKLLELIMQHYKIAKPFNDHLAKIIKS